MKTTKTLLILLLLVLNSCSSESENSMTDTAKNDIEKENDTAEKDFPISKFAMTANVYVTIPDTLIKKDAHRVLWEVNNPFGTNTATKPSLPEYPAKDFIQLDGKNGTSQITLYINRKNLAIGTYSFKLETYNPFDTQIEANFKINNRPQHILKGSISITALNKKVKRAAGTFSFYCVQKPEPLSSSNPYSIKITDGTFNYYYN
ncbi:hypothetical protein [Flavobacterium gelatinilyticum]|uniref:hypothetical protein n=1 Tax=Flavobacterium gelatinilyticum TaxID=3003260 RepID=UPI00247FC53A|nr:hypothetical protein [Flavobacterium gelatinilyticum]